MYALAPSPLSLSSRDYSREFSAALDFALTADEIFELYNNAPCGYHSLDAHGMILRINNTELKWLGYTRDEVVGRMDFADLIAPSFRDVYRETLSILAKCGSVRNVEFQLRRKDGTLLDALLECSAFYNDAGEYVSSRARVFDITDRKRSETGLRDQERFLDRVLQATADVVYVVDLETRRDVFVNPETVSQLGYKPDEIAAMSNAGYEALLHSEDREVVATHATRIRAAGDNDVLTAEYRLRHSDGTFRVFASRNIVLARNASGAVTQYLDVVQDVTNHRSAQYALEEERTRLKEFAEKLAAQRRELEAANHHLHTLAFTDGLTGLPNHRTFQERLSTEFGRARANATPLSLLLLDIDYFKQYNDFFGHTAGDTVLRAVGNVLRGATREGDTCARYGGEEFAVLLPGAGPESALRFAEQLRHAVEAVPDPNRPVTVCIGVASLHAGTSAPSLLIADAEAAIYRAKRSGRNVIRHADSTTLPQP